MAPRFPCKEATATGNEPELALWGPIWGRPTGHELGGRAVCGWGYRKHDDTGLLETIGVEVWSWATALKLGALQNCTRRSRDSALRTNERPPCHLSRACGFSWGPLKRVLSRPQASFEPQQGFVHPPGRHLEACTSPNLTRGERPLSMWAVSDARRRIARAYV